MKTIQMLIFLSEITLVEQRRSNKHVGLTKVLSVFHNNKGFCFVYKLNHTYIHKLYKKTQFITFTLFHFNSKKNGCLFLHHNNNKYALLRGIVKLGIK